MVKQLSQSEIISKASKGYIKDYYAEGADSNSKTHKNIRRYLRTYDDEMINDYIVLTLCKIIQNLSVV